MPSFAYTPASLGLTGGDIFPAPIRFTFTEGRLRFTGGTYNIGTTVGLESEAVADFRIDRLRRQLPIVDPQTGLPTQQYQQREQRVAEGIERAVAALQLQVTDLGSIVAAIQQAQAAAAAAIQTANATQAAINITNSFPDPPNVLTAASGGSITIAAHERVYGDGTRVSVNSGSVSGFASGDVVNVYYADAARAGGAVTFAGTTSPVAQAGDVHVIGAVTIPDVGQPTASGTAVTAPGVPQYPDGYYIEYPYYEY